MINARAAIEQMSSGQIGQPAACMIESNLALSVERRRLGRTGRFDYGVRSAALRNGVEPARDFPDIGRRCDDLSGVDSTAVDNFVDKPPRQAPAASDPALARPAAQKNGTEKSLKINHLQRQ